MTDSPSAPQPLEPRTIPPIRPSASLAGAIAIDGFLAGIAGLLVLALGLETGDRLAGSSGVAPALLGSAVLRGPAGPTGRVVGDARELAVGYALLALVALLLGAALSWWASRQPRFPSSGTAWLLAALGLGVGLLALDRVTACELAAHLGPWRILGGIVPAAVAMPLVLWQRQPRLVQNRRDLRDDEP